MPIFINGEAVNIPLAQLIAEGEEIIRRENIPPSKLFDQEFGAAALAVLRYDEAHRQWLEANQDGHMRELENEAREKVRQLRTVVEGESRRIEMKGRGAITETDHDKESAAAQSEIKRAIDEFRATHPEPMPIKVSISAFLDFDDDGGRKRSIGVSLSKEQCQQLYTLASIDMLKAVKHPPPNLTALVGAWEM